MRKTLLVGWLVLRAILVIILALFAFQIIYEVIWKVRVQGPNLQMALLVVPSATYLWWMIAQGLRLIGIKRSATFTMLLSLTLTIWLLVVTMHMQITDLAEDASEGVWGLIEKVVHYLVQLVF